MPARDFRTAVERQDLDAAVDLLSDDVVFRSPAVFKPYEGLEAVATILRTVFEVLEDFRYVDELEGEGIHGLVFDARVGDRSPPGGEGRTWTARQIIDDPDGNHDWAIVATVDLDASDAAGEPVIRTQSFAPAG